MTEQPDEPKLPETPEWLLSPEEESGLNLSIKGIASAEELTPEVLQALGRTLEELHKVAQVRAAAARSGCPNLRQCGVNSGNCPKLTVCGRRGGVSV